MAQQNQFKSNLLSICKEMKSINIKPKAKKELKKTPFWLLIQSILDKKLDQKMSRKSDNFIEQVLRQYDPENKTFTIKGHQLKISKRDIQLIFGIKEGELEITSLPKTGVKIESDFIKRCFKRNNDKARKGELTRIKISNALDKASRGNTKDDAEDVARLVTLYLLNTLFLPINSTTVAWGMTKYVEDVSNMSKYDWASYIFDVLSQSLATIDRNERPYRLTGCIMAIPYWFCEKLGPLEAKQGGIPRCLKWDLGQLPVSLDDPTFQAMNQPKNLKPTTKEIKLLNLHKENDDDERENPNRFKVQYHKKKYRKKLEQTQPEEKAEEEKARTPENHDDSEQHDLNADSQV